MIYGIVGLIGGLAMVGLSVQVLRRREGEAANKAAMSLFGFSILYLFLLFSALLAEQGLGLFRPVLG
jgi:protoheme IX farnesyltransferase